MASLCKVIACRTKELLRLKRFWQRGHANAGSLQHSYRLCWFSPVLVWYVLWHTSHQNIVESAAIAVDVLPPPPLLLRFELVAFFCETWVFSRCSFDTGVSQTSGTRENKEKQELRQKQGIKEHS